MGKGIDLAREADLQSGGSGAHANAMDDLKDQLIICLLKRLADKDGRVDVPVSEVDSTGMNIVLMRLEDRVFKFTVRRKQ